ncbi:TPA: DNA cytosine methyltransferase [Campylobacter jejuni]|nr:DNA cytosine methyltransferase [Campylobacter jejuni]ECO3390973.1 DNA cytosine methyltransferase [Campylobacter jejuni]ECR2944683.1 DNA cytosine methyltransferase [Campylobacter jejuni]HEC2872940.1 DNA cytosine methyltransferase [Campylobacter jejuni]HEG1497048.1 DNA cytosine methyltransferase [Campylobacter jejuni]
MKNVKYTIFETFVGAGGSHIGFMQEDFKTIYVNDISKDCIQTLTYNNPSLIEEKAFIDNSSILDIHPCALRKKLKVKVGDVDVFFGGVVCKGFSLAGERNPMDERNYLYQKQLELVKEFRPKISIIENVPGILNAKVYVGNKNDEITLEINNLWQELEKFKGKKAFLRKINSITSEFENEGILLKAKKEKLLHKINLSKQYVSVVDHIKSIYKSLGYKVFISILNSAWYGASTKRERVIIAAIRNDLHNDFLFPYPQYMSKNIYKSYFPKSILDLPKPKSINDALLTIDYSDKSDIDNIPMKHNEKTVARFKMIPEGDNIANHMDKLSDELKISKFYSRGATMRLKGDEPSPTLVPGHSNFPVHPREHRSITVREAAVITGFPLKYKFFGNHSKRCEQVGNAVPPPLARALAKECKRILYNFYNK